MRLLKYVQFGMDVCSVNVIWTYYIRHVNYQCQLRHFQSLHGIVVSIRCALGGKSRSSRYFLPIVL